MLSAIHNVYPVIVIHFLLIIFQNLTFPFKGFDVPLFSLSNAIGNYKTDKYHARTADSTCRNEKASTLNSTDLRPEVAVFDERICVFE